MRAITLLASVLLAVAPAVAVTPEDVLLLREIRDSLKK